MVGHPLLQDQHGPVLHRRGRRSRHGGHGGQPGDRQPTYYIIVTGSDTQNQYESRIYAVSNAISVTGPNGSISRHPCRRPVGFTYNVYVGTTTSPGQLGPDGCRPDLSARWPAQAVQLAAEPNRGHHRPGPDPGPARVPRARPALPCIRPSSSVAAPTRQVVLEDAKFTYLKDADKSDPLNQLRIVGWKMLLRHAPGEYDLLRPHRIGVGLLDDLHLRRGVQLGRAANRAPLLNVL